MSVADTTPNTPSSVVEAQSDTLVLPRTLCRMQLLERAAIAQLSKSVVPNAATNMSCLLRPQHDTDKTQNWLILSFRAVGSRVKEGTCGLVLRFILSPKEL